jgi:hypothetical protein
MADAHDPAMVLETQWIAGSSMFPSRDNFLLRNSEGGLNKLLHLA